MYTSLSPSLASSTFLNNNNNIVFGAGNISSRPFLETPATLYVPGPGPMVRMLSLWRADSVNAGDRGLMLPPVPDGKSKDEY